MSLDQFLQDPWKAANLHSLYQRSFFHMRPAPEYANGEVILASLYRNVGFGNAASEVSERNVSKNGNNLLRAIEKGRADAKSPSGLSVTAFRTVVNAVRSPRQPNQSSRRSFQIAPLVPEASIYSLAARLRGSPWNPGELIKKLVLMGTHDLETSKQLWRKLHASLSIEQNEDIWAQFLSLELDSWRPKDISANWSIIQEAQEENDFDLNAWRQSNIFAPASAFCNDLQRVIEVKSILTRRQWITVLESLLRIASTSHVLWTCKTNWALHNMLEESMVGKPPSSVEVVNSRLSSACKTWHYGQSASPKILESACEFVRARMWINLAFLSWDQALKGVTSLNSTSAILDACQAIAKHASPASLGTYKRNKLAVAEQDPRKTSCKRGIGKNVIEFLMHTLRQRPTSEVGMESYDQGYILKKRGSYSNAPWVVSLGPVSVLLFVHCCTAATPGPRTVEDFCSHLAKYGLNAEPQEVGGSDLGATLRNLGLVLDSPDAEGGMVIVSPFQNQMDQVK